MNKIFILHNRKWCKKVTVSLCLFIVAAMSGILLAETSANYEIITSLICSGGISASSSNYALPRSTIGDIIGGTSQASLTQVSSGYMSQMEKIIPVAEQEGGTLDIEVSGTVDDNNAIVDVNGTRAQVGNNTYAATITLREGANTITVTATDQFSNQAQKTITVYLDTKSPGRPTLNPIKSPTAISTQTLSGTKEADTSLWINGAMAIPVNTSTTWSYDVSLNSGTNSFLIASKDRAENESTAVETSIVLDPDAPAVNIDSPQNGMRTNNAFINVTGTINDSSAAVWVSGVEAAVNGGTFTAQNVPLTQPGPNIVTAQATNSTGHASMDVVVVTLGRFPIITSFVPGDGERFYEGQDVQVKISATDLDGDSVEYQFILDSVVKQGWSTVSTYDWNTGRGDRGQHTLVGEVKDGYGGEPQETSEIYLYIEPVALPTQ